MNIFCKNRKLLNFFARLLEKFFYRYGEIIGTYPSLTIAASLIIFTACSSGLQRWFTITDHVILWTPLESPLLVQKKWIEETFPKDICFESILIEGDNVLDKKYILFLLDLHEKINKLNAIHDISYKDICYRNPNAIENTSNITYSCLYNSILQLWNANREIISNLTEEDILKRVNEEINKKELHKSLQPSISTLLSGCIYEDADFINRTDQPKVIGAKAMLSMWFINNTFNPLNVEYDDDKETSYGQRKRNKFAQNWEKKFIALTTQRLNTSLDGLSKLKIYSMTENSYDDEIDEAVSSNLVRFIFGFCLLFVFILTSLGRWNPIGQRCFLSFAGMLVIGMSLGSSFGVCFYLKIFFAELHPVIPFLLLGIGVDDIFVIVQALDNLEPSERDQPLSRRIGLVMKEAGVSISVTSITDMAAFLISSTTKIPGMRSFCLFAAVGIVFLYLFAITFFIGCLAFDDRRMLQGKVFPWSKVKVEVKPKQKSISYTWCQKGWGNIFFEKIFSKCILKWPMQILTIILACILCGISSYGTYNIELNFNPIWYMRPHSHAAKFLHAMERHFPQHGERVEIYIDSVKYWEISAEMKSLEESITESAYVKEGSFDFWYTKLIEDCSSKFNLNCTRENEFKLALMFFIKQNPIYYNDIRFNDSSIEALSSFKFEIVASRARFQHGKLEDTKAKNLAMADIRNRLSEIILFDLNGNETTPLVYTYMYTIWEANKIINQELLGNLCITFATIVIITFFFVSNAKVSIMVLTCVLLTVNSVCGLAYFMGITIEIVSSIVLILTVGLALDYSAHFAVYFMCLKGGSKKERVIKSLNSVGNAIFKGAFSTFLALVVLSTSDTYVFTTFFKMFSVVISFGVFHGLCLLPVLLNIVGSSTNSSLSSSENELDLSSSATLDSVISNYWSFFGSDVWSINSVDGGPFKQGRGLNLCMPAKYKIWNLPQNETCQNIKKSIHVDENNVFHQNKFDQDSTQESQ